MISPFKIVDEYGVFCTKFHSLPENIRELSNVGAEDYAIICTYDEATISEILAFELSINGYEEFSIEGYKVFITYYA